MDGKYRNINLVNILLHYTDLISISRPPSCCEEINVSNPVEEETNPHIYIFLVTYLDSELADVYSFGVVLWYAIYQSTYLSIYIHIAYVHFLYINTY